jgi:hypothetical protein
MDVVVNEHTGTVHRQKPGSAFPHAVCGATYHLDRDRLRRTSPERAARDDRITKCGRCFDEGGGY